MAKNFKIDIKGEDLNGLKHIQEVVERYKKQKAKIGVLGGNYPNGTSYAEVAELHEFGIVTERTFTYKGKKITVNGVPARSWLRAPLKGKKLVDNTMLELIGYKLFEEFKNGYKGDILKLLSEEAVHRIQEAWLSQGDGKWDRNISSKYIALKGNDRPLIDTGELLRAVEYKVTEK